MSRSNLTVVFLVTVLSVACKGETYLREADTYWLFRGGEEPYLVSSEIHVGNDQLALITSTPSSRSIELKTSCYSRVDAGKRATVGEDVTSPPIVLETKIRNIPYELLLDVTDFDVTEKSRGAFSFVPKRTTIDSLLRYWLRRNGTLVEKSGFVIRSNPINVKKPDEVVRCELQFNLESTSIEERLRSYTVYASNRKLVTLMVVAKGRVECHLGGLGRGYSFNYADADKVDNGKVLEISSDAVLATLWAWEHRSAESLRTGPRDFVVSLPNLKEDGISIYVEAAQAFCARRDRKLVSSATYGQSYLVQ
jgi:hypothetical protein